MERRLAAILAADVVGYARLTDRDEAGTLARLEGLRAEILDPLIADHRGRVVNLAGDGFLVEFASVVDAVDCALAWQDEVEARARQVPGERAIRFRIGVNLGDVIVTGGDLHGHGVNLAVRLEGIAEPGAVLVSRTVANHAKGKLPAGFEDLGDRELKNIAEPVRVFRASRALDASGAPGVDRPRTRSRRFAALGAVLVLFAAAAGVALWLKPWVPRVESASEANMAFPLPDKPSIAVLPFANMSDDPRQEYFADGMTEDLITDLSKVSGLFVIARNSSFAYKGRQVRVRQVAEDLGVRYVLEGSVRRVGNEVRINAQLIDAVDGGHLWAERYDGTLDDIFALQDQVTGQIVAALAVNLTPEDVKRRLSEASSPKAYDAFLQGWEYYRRQTAEDFSKAIPHFEKAANFDPEYGRTYAALAAIYFLSWQGGQEWTDAISPREERNNPWGGAIEKAKENLQLAMRNPTPLAFQVASRMHMDERQFDDAVAAADRAVELDQNDPEGHLARGLALTSVGRGEGAIVAAEHGLRLDPLYPWPYLYVLGIALMEQGEFQEALNALERASNWSGATTHVHAALAITYANLDRMEEAESSLQAYIDAWPWPPRVERVMQYWPFRREADIRLFGGGLVKAGLCCEDRLQHYIEALGMGGTMEPSP